MPFIEINNVSKYYTNKKAVDNISATIEKGKIYGLLGPNGAGKTSLIRMITGITYPDEGTILINQEKFSPMKHISTIGYMPEERGLFKKVPVGEQVIYLAQLRGLSKAEAIQQAKYWFKRLDIMSWWTKKIEELSKGMAQKIQFIVTIIHQPQLIILDEPFSGLDPINSIIIKDLIYELAQKKAAIIFSTHRMEQVEEICNHIYLVNNGKIILEGELKNVRKKFQKAEYLLNLGTDSEITSNHLFTVLQQNANKDYIISLLPNIKANDVLQYLIQNNFLIDKYEHLIPTLNDIFIQCVQNNQP